MRLQLRSSLVKPAKKVIGKQRLTVLVNVSSPAPYPQREPVTTGSLFALCFNDSQSWRLACRPCPAWRRRSVGSGQGLRFGLQVEPALHDLAQEGRVATAPEADMAARGLRRASRQLGHQVCHMTRHRI